MPVTQGTQEPKYLYTTPEGKRYFDETGSTLAAGRVFDPAKTAVDYGIKNPDVFGVIESGGNGGETPSG